MHHELIGIRLVGRGVRLSSGVLRLVEVFIEFIIEVIVCSIEVIEVILVLVVRFSIYSFIDDLFLDILF